MVTQTTASERDRQTNKERGRISERRARKKRREKEKNEEKETTVRKRMREVVRLTRAPETRHATLIIRSGTKKKEGIGKGKDRPAYYVSAANKET